MKKLTLELYDKIIDAVHEESKNHLRMLGDITHDLCAEYIGFYAHHGGLFWSEQEGKICGVATIHPGKRDFDWQWQEPEEDWTAHVIWGKGSKPKADILCQFLGQQSRPIRFWACRRNKFARLCRKKLERILSYGPIWNQN